MRFKVWGHDFFSQLIENLAAWLSDMNNFRMIRRLITNCSASFSSAKAFTLIELVIVIAIIGILSSLAIPKFLDMSAAAKIAATKAGLGSVRAALAIKYASSATGGATASYPATLTTADFAGAESPKNGLTGNAGVNPLAVTVSGTTTHATLGFWYVSDNTNAAGHAGRAGAYTSSTSTDTSAY